MNTNIINQSLIENQPIPVDIDGTKLILSQLENCICKIYKNDKKGTGFFCKIPFPDKNNLLNVLITNNHILNENDIENNQIINLIMYNKGEKLEKKIIMDETRKSYTCLNQKDGIDITIIEIKPNIDNINNYLEIDDEILEIECHRKSIYLLHYPKDKRLVSYGLMNDIMGGKKINHYCNSVEGSSGSPILSLDNFKVIGVHYATSNKTNIKLNYGTYIKYIINEFNNKYKKEAKLLYSTNEEGKYNIFGDKFVKNNKNNIDLIINGIKNNLIQKYKLGKGINKIELIIKNKITNLEYMFYECNCLINIDGLKYLDTKDINNFENIFYECSLLSDINALKYWNVSNSKNFENMFYGCSSLSDINELKGWNVSNSKNFKGMFFKCSSLLDINGLKDWNVSNAYNFEGMFGGCSLLTNINGLANWNVSNSNNFKNMFARCSSLSDINGLRKWNVSNSKNFIGMFYGCFSLKNIDDLIDWDVKNADNIECMFRGCSLLHLSPLKNWKLSNYDYESMK